MTEFSTKSASAQSDPNAERLRELTARAERAGYILTRSAVPRYEWTLIDSEYRENIFSSTDLGRIEQWLES